MPLFSLLSSSNVTLLHEAHTWHCIKTMNKTDCIDSKIPKINITMLYGLKTAHSLYDVVVVEVVVTNCLKLVLVLLAHE